MSAISFDGRHFRGFMIPQSVRCYLAYALSYRDIEEIMQERCFDVNNSNIHRCCLRKTIGSKGKPNLINIDQSAANIAGSKQ